MAKQKAGKIRFQVSITAESHARLKALSDVSGKAMCDIGGEMLEKFLEIKVTTERIRARHKPAETPAKKPPTKEEAREEGRKQAERFIGSHRARTVY